MGLFHKKKNTATSASVLSESEIQKKLYGDLVAQAPHVVIGERDHFREPVSAQPLSRKAPPEKEPVEDLFFTSPTPEAGSDRAPTSEPKPVEPAPRYVPLHDFESRTAAQTAAASGADASARFPYNRPSQKNLASVAALFKNILNPKHMVFRKVFLWGGVVLVVFLLFWGVNALNSQREVAMHTRYVPRVDPVVPAKLAAPVAESLSVSTPVPVKKKVAFAPRTSGTADVTVTPAVVKSSYYIQVVTYPTRADAEQIVESFKKSGIRSSVKENSRPSGRLFYVVVLGGFRTEAEAQAQLLKFRSTEVARPFQDAFVKSSKS